MSAGTSHEGVVGGGCVERGRGSNLWVRRFRGDGNEVRGVYGAGEASARSAAGVGYNSGYSLSRAMSYGYLAVHDIVQKTDASGPVTATRQEA